jgi:hypothetical protein
MRLFQPFVQAAVTKITAKVAVRGDFHMLFQFVRADGSVDPRSAGQGGFWQPIASRSSFKSVAAETGQNLRMDKEGRWLLQPGRKG